MKWSWILGGAGAGGLLGIILKMLRSYLDPLEPLVAFSEGAIVGAVIGWLAWKAIRRIRPENSGS
jgi:hypothetical protein